MQNLCSFRHNTHESPEYLRPLGERRASRHKSHRQLEECGDPVRRRCTGDLGRRPGAAKGNNRGARVNRAAYRAASRLRCSAGLDHRVVQPACFHADFAEGLSC